MEVMVGAGLLAVVSFGFMEVLKTSTFGVKTMNAQDNTRTVGNDICQVLNSTQTGSTMTGCDYTFASAYNTLSTASPSTPSIPVSQIVDVTNSARFVTGSVYGTRTLVLKGMHFGSPPNNKVSVAPTNNPRFNTPDWDPVSGIGSLTIHWQQTGTNGKTDAGIGLQDLYRSILIKFNPTTPMTCSCISANGGGASLGSGTANTLTMWGSSGMTIVDSGVIQSPSGNIGIGTTIPGQLLEVNGNIKGTAFVSTSDRRLKSDIRPIEGLDLITKMEGVRFSWLSTHQPDFGVVAQDMEKILPEAVVTDERTGLKSVKYSNLIAPAIEAIKELHGEEVAQKRRQQSEELDLSRLRQELARQSAKIDALGQQLRTCRERQPDGPVEPNAAP